MSGSSSQLTLLLQQWSHGNESVVQELMPLVYQELHRLAQAYLNREHPGHTLQPTALIHEAYIRLIDQGQPDWNSRSHFFRFSAHLMRQVLVDHARAARSAKRGGDQYKLSLDQVNLASPEQDIDLLALDEALNRLAAFDERRARVLELRFFGGMTEEEAGEAIGISVATVRRELRLAEAWLYRELARPADRS